MKKLFTSFFLLISFTVSAQQSFVHQSKASQIKKQEYEKKNLEAARNIFPQSDFRKGRFLESAVPVTLLDRETLQESGNLNISLSPGVVIGGRSETHNPAIQLRGVKRFKNRFNQNQIPSYVDVSGLDDLPALAFAERIEVIGQDKTKYGSDVTPGAVAKYLDDMIENTDVFEFTEKTDFEPFNYNPTIGFTEGALEEKVTFATYENYSTDGADEIRNNYFRSFEVAKINYHVSAQYNYFFGKNAGFDGSNFTYDPFSIFNVNGGIDYNPCTRGGVELDVGPALEFYSGGSSLGFNARLGGYYDLTPPAKRLANSIYTGEAKMNYSLNGGFSYYDIAGGSTLTFGLGIQVNFK